jgi:hypothetical protein
MSIRHLYISRAEVQRLKITMSNGSMTNGWTKLSEIVDPRLGVPGELMCRLDLNFVRPGKDQPSALVAGRAIDRVGVLFCDATPHLLAGDRLKLISGPLTGTFELKATPDGAVDFSNVHHLEVQVVEVAPSATRFPGSSVGGS